MSIAQGDKDMKFLTWLRQMLSRPFRKLDECLTHKAMAEVERQDKEAALKVISRIPYGR